jgi:sugar-specific transcriptional regulator TrmB
MKIETILQQLGFSENEMHIYFASLEMGLSSAQDIAKTANIKRTTAYSVLEYLVKRGVVGKTIVRGKTRYVAEPPEKLLHTVNDVRASLEKALPELEALYNKNETKPRITFYEGDKAVQTVYDDTLREKPDEILEWNTDEYFMFDQHKVDPHYIDKRVKLGIQAKRIAGAGSGWDKKHKRYDRAELSETVIVPRDQFWPGIEVNIYGSKVAFLNYTEQMSVIIESRPIADAMRQAYYLSWRGAKLSEVKTDNPRD